MLFQRNTLCFVGACKHCWNPLVRAFIILCAIFVLHLLWAISRCSASVCSVFCFRQDVHTLHEGIALDYVSGRPMMVPSAHRSISGSPCVQFSSRNTTGDKRSNEPSSTRNCVECNEGDSGRGINSLVNYISQYNCSSFINENVPLTMHICRVFSSHLWVTGCA